MKIVLLLSGYILGGIHGTTTSVGDVDYRDQDNWGGRCNTGRRQSPIIIFSEEAKTDPKLQPIKFQGYERMYGFVVENTGNYLEVELDSETAVKGLPFVYGGAHGKTKYRFHDINVHWGDSKYAGSAHKLDDEQYAGEIQLIHYNDKYDSVDDAAASAEKDAILILVFFFKYEPSVTGNPVWEEIIDRATTSAGTRPSGGKGLRDALALAQLLPSTKPKEYFHYKGSSMYPDCPEVVSYYIFERTVPISETAWDNLQLLTSDGTEPLTPNLRYTQPLHNRKVKAYRPGYKRTGKPRYDPRGSRAHGSKGYSRAHGSKGYSRAHGFKPRGYSKQRGYYGPRRSGKNWRSY